VALTTDANCANDSCIIQKKVICEECSKFNNYTIQNKAATDKKLQQKLQSKVYRRSNGRKTAARRPVAASTE
jgi:hypothetical protein